MGKRQEAALETRKKVVDAAGNLILEKGFDAVSVEDITAKAGVAKGTFYTYFKRKEDIISELTNDGFSPIRESSGQLEGEAADRIEAFLLQSMGHITKTGRKLAQQWLHGALNPEGGMGVKKLEYDLAAIAEFLKDAVDKEMLSKRTPVEDLAREITAEYYGALVLWCISDGTVDPEDLLRSYCARQLWAALDVFRNEKRNEESLEGEKNE